MRALPIFLLIAFAGTAAASSASFSMHPGERKEFVVTGSQQPTLTVTKGTVHIVSEMYVAGAWLVTLECDASSPVDCEGTIES